MRRGNIRWEPFTRIVDQAHRSFVRQQSVPDAPDAMPRHDAPLTARDEAIFLLHVAATIEHSLLVQYLYASFSLGEPLDPRVPKASQQSVKLWQTIILKIAEQEMGHLMGVQNLLLGLGGPLTLDRGDFPFKSEFYPFPFVLEPLTKDSLAKYIAAEKPEKVPPEKQTVVDEIVKRAVEANQDMPVNRVGRLYEQIIRLFGQLNTSDFRSDSADSYQSSRDEWDPFQDVEDLTVTRVRTPKEAIDKILVPIAEQGEGIISASAQIDPKSHFAKFLSIYEGMDGQFQPIPETNPRYGVLTWQPAATCPRHPNTSPSPWSDASLEDGRITAMPSLSWAQLFNLRYRKLLAFITHAMDVSYKSAPNCRANLIVWALNEMGNLASLSGQLIVLPRQAPNIFEGGLPAVAGAPFELPYTLNLPNADLDRWRFHADLIEDSCLQIVEVRKYSNDPTGLLQPIESYDALVLGVIQMKLQHPNGDCAQPSTPSRKSRRSR